MVGLQWITAEEHAGGTVEGCCSGYQVSTLQAIAVCAAMVVPV
jgi:hypothetical protein